MQLIIIYSDIISGSGAKSGNRTALQPLDLNNKVIYEIIENLFVKELQNQKMHTRVQQSKHYYYGDGLYLFFINVIVFTDIYLFKFNFHLCVSRIARNFLIYSIRLETSLFID